MQKVQRTHCSNSSSRFYSTVVDWLRAKGLAAKLGRIINNGSRVIFVTEMIRCNFDNLIRVECLRHVLLRCTCSMSECTTLNYIVQLTSKLSSRTSPTIITRNMNQ